MTRRFSSLHNHSAKDSILDSTMTPEFVVEQAYNLGYKAVSLTGHGTMLSFVDGYKKAKELGIKYIPGSEVYETDGMYIKEPGTSRYHLILLAQNDIGLKNLFTIVSKGYTDGFYVKPRVDLKLIKQHSEGVIALSACLGGRIARLLHSTFCKKCKTEGHGSCEHTQEKWDEAVEWVHKYKEVFGDNFYLEMQSHDTLIRQKQIKKFLN